MAYRTGRVGVAAGILGITGLLFAGSSAHALVGAPANATLQNMAPNSWYEVPDSEMRQVEAKDADFPGIWAGNNQGSHGLFYWSGGAFDTKRNRLIIWGGGHNAYYGNEIYTFDLTTLAWERINDPSPPTTPAVCTAILADGNPNSRHTYYTVEYVPTIDKFFETPDGTTSCEASGSDVRTWTFDFDSQRWENMAPTGTRPPTWAPTEAAYDPILNKVYSAGPEGLFAYDVATNDWQQLNNKGLVWSDRSAVVDPKRHLLFLIGGYDDPGTPYNDKVIVYDVGNGDYTPQFWETTGDEFIDNGYRPGANYDPVADRIVVWDGGKVHVLDVDNRAWSHLASAPQDQQTECFVADRGCKNGTYGRFRYSPRENAYVAVNDSRLNVMIYKLADPNAAPTVVDSPSPVSANEGTTATFTVTAVGAAPVSYQWRKNGVAISGATGTRYDTPPFTRADNGAVFDCVVTNNQGSVVSTGAVVTTTVDNITPTIEAVISTTPALVRVIFSEAVEQATAENPVNYSLDGGITIQSATLASDQKTLQLTVSELTEGTPYTLTVSGVRDRAATPNTIAAFSSQGFTYRAVDDFESGTAANWIPLTAGRWSVVQDNGDYAYFLNTSAYGPQSGDRLGEYALLPGAYGDFELSLQARLGDAITDNPQADYAVVFGYQDANNYYYMMFNADKTYSQLYKVVKGSRVVVASTARDWLNDTAYHGIGVRRSGDVITVTFDGSDVLSITNSTFGVGRIGIGSFNDAAYFDDIQLVGGSGDMGGSGGTGGTGSNVLVPTDIGGGGAGGPLLLLLLLAPLIYLKGSALRKRVFGRAR